MANFSLGPEGRAWSGRREDGGAPGGTKAFLGFPCPTGCSVRHLAQAGDVGFGGCEIAPAEELLVSRDDSVCSDEGKQVNRDAYPAELAPSCSLSAMF